MWESASQAETTPSDLPVRVKIACHQTLRTHDPVARMNAHLRSVYLGTLIAAMMIEGAATGDDGSLQSAPVDQAAYVFHPFRSGADVYRSDAVRPLTSQESGAWGGWSNEHLRVTPYGSLWAKMYFATRRTAPGEFTLWVLPEDEHGEHALSIDARRSRIGVDIEGPAIGVLGGMQTRGQIEADFFGQFVTENRAGARLRQAWWEMRNDDYAFLIGQTWDVISPLRPGTLNFTVGCNAGNIGFRRAQFRVERYVDVSDEWLMTLQASANQDIIADFPTEPGVRSETASWPVLEGRVGFSLIEPSDDSPSVEVGTSAHIGETGFDFFVAGPPPQSLPPENDTRFITWSWNVDVRVQHDQWLLQGELFTGANLSAFLGGIGQGVCPCLRKSIRSTGGWFEAAYLWTPEWESHFGFGIEDPRNEDALLGRKRNQFVFSNIIWHVSPRLRTGMELSWWKTVYADSRRGLVPDSVLTADGPARSLTVEWMVRYDFQTGCTLRPSESR